MHIWQKVPGCQNAVRIMHHHSVIDVHRTVSGISRSPLLVDFVQIIRCKFGEVLLIGVCIGKYLYIDVNIYVIMITCATRSYFLRYFMGKLCALIRWSIHDAGGGGFPPP
jgi:hypothetical protein